jgi:hypothetical protein
MIKNTDNLIWWFLLALLLLPVNARATIEFSNFEAVAFSSSGVIPGASHSPGLSITKNGLRQDETAIQFHDLWVQSQTFAFGSGVGSPRSVYLLLTLTGNFIEPTTFPRTCFFRFSADGRHWTSWQAFADEGQSDSADIRKTRRYKAVATVSQTQREKFEEYRVKWKQRPESKGSDNEQLISAWIIKQDPTFFERYIPFVGFVQVRIEGTSWPKDRTVMKEAILRMDWGFGGFRKLFR